MAAVEIRGSAREIPFFDVNFIDAINTPAATSHLGFSDGLRWSIRERDRSARRSCAPGRRTEWLSKRLVGNLALLRMTDELHTCVQ
jgi:hypothetical protein